MWHFEIWLYSLSIILWRFIQDVSYSNNTFFFLLLCSILWHGCIPVCLTIQPIEGHLGCFQRFGYYKDSHYKHLCSSFCMILSLYISWIKPSVIQLPGCSVVTWLIFFLQTAVPFYIPIRTVWGIQLLCTLVSI